MLFEEVNRFLALLTEPGEIVEVRVLDVPKSGMLAGYFNNWEALLRAIKPHDSIGNIYVSLNPPNPALLARAENRLIVRPKATTGDADIIRRRWVLVDVDPVRPSGIPATNEEKGAAVSRALEIRAWLRERGWPEPVLADSGNGAYLLYRVDLSNDDGANKLIRDCLLALALKFDDEKVTVDTSVSNASKLIRLIGTTNRKGDGTTDRPHRRSRLLQVPNELGLVPEEKLRELAALAPRAEPKPPAVRRGVFDLAEWIAKFNLPVARQKPWQGNGRVWVLNPCPFDENHSNQSAFIAQFPDGRIAAGCHHASCQWWGWKELREKYEPDAYAKLRGRKEENDNVELEEDHTPLPPAWPDPPAPAAFYGLVGEIVNAIGPHTEADAVALLVQTLIFFGNVIGRKAYFTVGADKHFTNEFAILVGTTAKARKGTSFSHVRRIFQAVDPEWTKSRIQYGLSTGEGLIWAVRDPIKQVEKPRRGKNKSKDETWEPAQVVTVDPGVEDKRLLVYEAEFASTLRVLRREGNTLSPTIRNAWDTGDLQMLTKSLQARASGAHISIIGHITKNELLRYLDATEAGNGFANRFLWACVRRSRILPLGGQITNETLQPLIGRLREAVQFARRVDEMRFDPDAEALWCEVYPELSEGRPGLLGAMTARAEAHVLRLASIYALLDKFIEINRPHLEAALALWDYCYRSARFIFGDALGDPVADEILSALRQAGSKGLTRTQIRDLFDRNMSAQSINRALISLLELGLARTERKSPEAGKGRPIEYWFAIEPNRYIYDKNDINDKIDSTRDSGATPLRQKSDPESPTADFCRNTLEAQNLDAASNVVNVVNVVKDAFDDTCEEAENLREVRI